MADDDQRAERIAALIDEAKKLSEQIQQVPTLVTRRREVVAQLVAENVPVVQIAAELGMSRQAVYQLLDPKRRLGS